ncbi:PP2C family protein-serine/threonine phosphatase [Microbacterium rhizosphaerae]|uniref:PP2C family protein-serine/threonine phosphatase n=1 Tax=Microbacterium rhizosphaerae TaxID=1678237 RepID=UPI0031F2DAF3
MAAAASDAGRFRSENQDAAFTASWGAGVADGVGGGPAGDLASAAFLRRLAAAHVDVRDEDDLAERLRGANWDLRAHVWRDPSLEGMATTFTGIVVARGGHVLIGHSGDSRAYRLRAGVATRETRDDSLVQSLVDHGLLAPEAAASHPRRNIVTASMTGAEDDHVTVGRADAAVGDRWLFCSDGLTDYVPEERIFATLARPLKPARVAAELVAIALAAPTRDNVTVVVCDIADGDADAGERPVFYGAAAGLFAEELEELDDDVDDDAGDTRG